MTVDECSKILIEAPIAGIKSASLHDINSAYREKITDRNLVKEREEAIRIYKLLYEISGYHFQSNNKFEPYTEMLSIEGKRSANLSDLEPGDIQLLKDIKDEITFLPLKARLYDVIWFLDRSEYQFGVNAVSSYLEIVIALEANQLIWNDEETDNYLNFRTVELLNRAIIINSSLAENLQNDNISETLVEFRKKALVSKDEGLLRKITALDLDFSVSSAEEIAADLEAYLGDMDSETGHSLISLYDLAANAFHQAKINDKKWHYKRLVAETYVDLANSHDMALQKAHWMSQAIAKYAGIPDTKDRRKELRHKLIDIQANLNDEFHSFERKEDISGIINEQLDKIANLSVLKILKELAIVAVSRDKKELEEEAIKYRQKHLFSSLFESTYHDRDGKVKFRAQSTSPSDQGELITTISQNEEIYRNVVVAGSVLPILRAIQRDHYISETMIETICINSPFIPTHHRTAYKSGIIQFLKGDMISALSILTPQLENSVRYVLRSSGHDTTIFDETTQMQEERSLSSIFSNMKEELNDLFGENIVFEIELLFLSKAGPNFRNEIAHGLLHDDEFFSRDAIYACWFIFHLCCYPLLSEWDNLEKI